MPSREQVIIIEDERESRDFLVELLEIEGFQVAAFPNGAEALEHLAHSDTPGVILLDIKMPVMDGRQFREAMLKDQRLAKVPVVIVTAFEPQTAAALLPFRVFRKPVDVDALLKTVRQVC